MSEDNGIVKTAGRISDKTWADIRMEIVNWPKDSDRPDYNEIGLKFGVNPATIQNTAIRRGWLEERLRLNSNNAQESLVKVGTQLASTLSDTHQVLQAALEAAQKSYHIALHRDANGDLHFLRTENRFIAEDEWDQMSDVDKIKAQKYIKPEDIRGFIDILLAITDRRINIVKLIASNVKGSLPRFEPTALNLERRDGTDIFAEVDLMDLKNQLTGFSGKANRKKKGKTP